MPRLKALSREVEEGECWVKLTSTQGNLFLTFHFEYAIPEILHASHEGLMLNYEEALTRELPIPVPVDSAPSLPSSPGTRSRSAYFSRSPSSKSNDVNGVGIHEEGQGSVPHAWYNTSAHFIWVGDRTRQLDGAHIEYFRGIRNPIGIKVGPSMGADELVQLLDSMSCLGIAMLNIKTHPEFLQSSIQTERAEKLP